MKTVVISEIMDITAVFLSDTLILTENFVPAREACFGLIQGRYMEDTNV